MNSTARTAGDSADDAAGGAQQIKSVGKAIGILEAIAAGRTPPRITDLAAHLRMSVSSVSRLVATLREHGLVETDPVTGRCSIGLGAALLGNAAFGRRQLDQVARPWIMELSNQFDEYINLSRLYRGRVIYQRGTSSDGILRAGIHLGGVLPVHCTAPGKILIAWLPVEQITSILRAHGMEGYTANTITGVDAMLAELEQVRRTGFAYDNEELVYGLRGVGVAVRGADGRVIAALSTGVGGGRLHGEKQAAMEQALAYAARQISREMGYVAGASEDASGVAE
jgi:DNA-binding IclR family transcriptional regulator